MPERIKERSKVVPKQIRVLSKARACFGWPAQVVRDD